MSNNFLGKILEHKRQEVARQQKQVSEDDLRQEIITRSAPRSLYRALTTLDRPAIISEIKKASPSEGVIRPDFDPLQIAHDYINAGASALSILTDVHFFQGSLDYVRRIRPVSKIPLLRKDFIIDPYQVLEARAAGADALLLIVAALTDGELGDLLSFTRSLNMEALVEVHDEAEYQRAVRAGARIIGVNNRNLTTFEVDLAVTERIAGQRVEGIAFVGESGISSADDIRRMVKCGVDAMLVGTHFMRKTSPGQALRSFIKEVDQCCE